MFKGLLLHRTDRVYIFVPTIDSMVMYLVASLTIAEIEKLSLLEGSVYHATNNAGVVLLNGFYLVNYYLYI